MKNLTLSNILFLFFFYNASAQQKDTLPVTLNYGGVTITGTLIIPHQTTTGAPKSYVDSSVANKALQSYVQTSLFAKQDKLIAGNNIQINGNVISATGGGGTVTAPLNLTIAPINNFQTFTPSNYLQTYPSNLIPGGIMKAYRFEYSYRSDNSNGEAMPDNVYNLSYNLDPQGNRYGKDDAGFRFGFETNYKIGNRLAMERHNEIYPFNGSYVRVESDYMYKDNGETFRNSIMDNHTYYSVFKNIANGGVPYMNIHSINGGGIWGGLDMIGEASANFAGQINFIQTLYPKSILNGGGFGVSIQTGGTSDNRFWADSRGNIMLNGSIDNNADLGTTFIGTASTGDYRSINPKAKLQVESKVKGVLLVRMTSAQRLAMVLTTTDEGMEVYDMDFHTKMFWNGSTWKAVATVSQ